MGLLQNYLRKLREKKDSKRDFEWQRNVEDSFEERKKGSDERELERFHEEDRKKYIKVEVKKRRQQMNDEIWSGRMGNPAFAPNITTGDKNLFSANNDFAKVQSITKVPNITKVKNITKAPNMFMK